MSDDFFKITQSSAHALEFRQADNNILRVRTFNEKSEIFNGSVRLEITKDGCLGFATELVRWGNRRSGAGAYLTPIKKGDAVYSYGVYVHPDSSEIKLWHSEFPTVTELQDGQSKKSFGANPKLSTDYLIPFKEADPESFELADNHLISMRSFDAQNKEIKGTITFELSWSACMTFADGLVRLAFAENPHTVTLTPFDRTHAEENLGVFVHPESAPITISRVEFPTVQALLESTKP